MDDRPPTRRWVDPRCKKFGLLFVPLLALWSIPRKLESPMATLGAQLLQLQHRRLQRQATSIVDRAPTGRDWEWNLVIHHPPVKVPCRRRINPHAHGVLEAGKSSSKPERG
ncbi:hypothetical protein D9619_009378 [Psilocybe cf. subviscida]|uniref:Uncharacterized protein n=1 Tax=Psilocybe cf. subviscida TaxID=2480587 RepID=A0A8H5BVF7_9AGAR|nr:hypothetical protein D9619_009378 [Psilocybe cf. subviscida]